MTQVKVSEWWWWWLGERRAKILTGKTGLASSLGSIYQAEVTTKDDLILHWTTLGLQHKHMYEFDEAFDRL